MGEALVKPGLGVVKTWQGILEICLRVAALVLALVVIIAASSVQGNITTLIRESDFFPVGKTTAAAGWLIFVAIITIIYELLVIVLRFLNIQIITSFITVVLIVDAIVHAVMAVSVFIGSVALLSYISEWDDFEDSSVFSSAVGKIITSIEATAAFSFFLIGVYIGLIIVIVLGGMVLKWGATRGNYAASGDSSSKPV